MKHNIKITFDVFTIKQPFISGIIRACIEETLRQEQVQLPCEINVLITNDRGIQAINQAYRNIDRPTDVLSFPMFSLEAGVPPKGEEYLDPETSLCPLGDMAINLQRAVDQAKEYGHSAKREIGYLTIHSILHLLGYDHMDEGEQKAQMRKREEQIAQGLQGMSRA